MDNRKGDNTKHIDTDSKPDECIDYLKYIRAPYTDMRANNCKTLEWKKNMNPEIIKEAVKEHKNIVNEVVKEKRATYELIKTEIQNRIINVPPINVQHAKLWLDAYSAFQNDILDLLEKLESFDIERCKYIGNK